MLFYMQASKRLSQSLYNELEKKHRCGVQSITQQLRQILMLLLISLCLINGSLLHNTRSNVMLMRIGGMIGFMVVERGYLGIILVKFCFMHGKPLLRLQTESLPNFDASYWHYKVFMICVCLK